MKTSHGGARFPYRGLLSDRFQAGRMTARASGVSARAQDVVRLSVFSSALLDAVTTGGTIAPVEDRRPVCSPGQPAAGEGPGARLAPFDHPFGRVWGSGVSGDR